MIKWSIMVYYYNVNWMNIVSYWLRCRCALWARPWHTTARCGSIRWSQGGGTVARTWGWWEMQEFRRQDTSGPGYRWQHPASTADSRQENIITGVVNSKALSQKPTDLSSLSYVVGPRSLSQMSRLCIRRSLGQKGLNRAGILPLPHILHSYILYQ